MKNILEGDKFVTKWSLTSDGYVTGLTQRYIKFATLYHALDSVNLKTLLTKDVISDLLEFSATYKSTSEHVKLPIELSKANSTDEYKNIVSKFSDDIAEISTGKIFAAEILKLANEKHKNVEIYNVQPIRVDGTSLHGVITFIDEKDDVRTEYVKYTLSDFGSEFEKMVSEMSVPRPKELLELLNAIGTPSTVLDKLSKEGETDAKNSESSLKDLEGISKQIGGTGVAPGHLITETYNIIPKAINGNIINYYNNVKNLLDYVGYIYVAK